MRLYLTVLTLTSTSAVLAAVPAYGQCGGQSHTGETSCAEGYQCHEYNQWYSQCVPGSKSGASSVTSSKGSSQPSKVPVPSINGTLGGGVGRTATTLLTHVSTAVATSTAAADQAASNSSTAAASPSSTAGTGNGTSNFSGANGADCSINDKFKAHSGKLYIGVAADKGTLSDATNEQIIAEDFGQVTPENRYV